MKVLFCYKSCESLGIEYLSAVLKDNGHETALAFDPGLFADKRYLNQKILSKAFSFKDSFKRHIKEENPDLIAFSVITDYYEWACEIAGWAKKQFDIPVVFGGVHPTIRPEEVMENSFVDFVIRGEGEYALLELVNALSNGAEIEKINNLCYKKEGTIHINDIRPFDDELDKLPYPDKDLFREYIPLSYSYRVFTSRGCYYKCSYCIHSTLKKIYNTTSKIRFRSPDNVIDELKAAHKKYGFKYVFFQDDIFASDISWAREFFSKYKNEIKLPFVCISHPLCLSEELILILKNCGCRRVFIGIQTLDDRINESVLLRTDTKKKVIEKLKLFQKYRLNICIECILGIPGETESGFIENADVFIEYKKCIDRIKCFYLTYYPGTDIIEISERMGVLKKSEIEDSRKYSKGSFYINEFLYKNRPDEARLARNFETFFKIIPLVPKLFSKIILKLRIYRFFYIIPKILLLLLDLLNGIRNFDVSIINYMKYYFIMSKRVIHERIGPKLKNQ